jgi:hypothetical protein
MLQLRTYRTGRYAVPPLQTKVASAAAIEPDPVDATTAFRFALRVPTSQKAGSYIAPITFEVLAPNA